jgi:hypothetical protein
MNTRSEMNQIRHTIKPKVLSYTYCIIKKKHRKPISSQTWWYIHLEA